MRRFWARNCDHLPGWAGADAASKKKKNKLVEEESSAVVRRRRRRKVAINLFGVVVADAALLAGQAWTDAASK